MVEYYQRKEVVDLDERIKKLRKVLDLTQQEFANRIGIKRNTIANYEAGRNAPIDSVVSLICREFGVNEAWLRTGEGEMFAPAPTNELDALAERYPDLTHESLVFIEKLIGLSRSDQNVIMGFLREVVEGFGDVSPGTQAKPKNDHEWSAEELHAELDRQLQMEEQATGESEVS